MVDWAIFSESVLLDPYYGRGLDLFPVYGTPVSYRGPRQ